MDASTWIRWCLAVLFVGVGFIPLIAPSPLPADAADTTFSAERAIEHVAEISREPHPVGSKANADVREYLVGSLEALGLEPVKQAMSAPSYYTAGGEIDVVNVYATIPGTASTGTIALVAHYDTFPATGGANDNSAGVAAVLETGRALRAGPSLRNDVMLLFTDGEEPAPRFGSTAFVDEVAAASDVALVVNFEAVGNAGPSVLVETSGPGPELVARYADAVPDPVAFSFTGETIGLIGDLGTDFDPFRNAGIPGFHVAYTRGSSIYHTAADDLGSVSLGSLQHHGTNGLGVARGFGDVDLQGQLKAGGAVYFTLGSSFVQYPGWVSIAGAVVAALVVVGRMWTAAPDRGSGLRNVASDVGRGLLAVSGVTLAMTLAWVLIASFRSSPSALEGYVYLFGLLAVGAGALCDVARRRSAGVDNRRVGFTVMWVALGLVTSLIVPGFSYLFVWPALAAAAVFTWRSTESNWIDTLRFAWLAGPTIILAVPAIDFFFQFGQPRPGNPDSSLPAVAAVGFLLAMLVVGLVHEATASTSEIRSPRRLDARC